MGDIAEQIIEGSVCQGCLVDMGGGYGYPVYCHSCQDDLGVSEHGGKSKSEKVRCPHCKKKVKEVGLQMHIKAVHKKS